MKPSKILSRVAATAAFALAASAANADTYDFVLTGDYSAHWQLSSSPTPDFVSDGDHFSLYDVAGTFPTSDQNLVDMFFYHADAGGGMVIDDFYGDNTLLVADGVQLYSGNEDAPTFLVGTFTLDGTSYGFGNYTLTITNVSAVPEPESYAMLLAGIGALGFVAARRRKV